MNELCIDQLNTELSNKAAREVEMGVELEAVTKELNGLRAKLKYSNATQAFAAQMLKNSVQDNDSDDTFATAKQSTSSASSRAAKPSVSSAAAESPVKARLTRSRSRTSLNFSEAQESFISCRNR